MDGGCLNSGEELRKFAELTGILVASTLTGGSGLTLLEISCPCKCLGCMELSMRIVL